MKIPVYCAHKKISAISSLKPNPANPNTHPPEQIALLAKIMAAHGWRNPIVVSNRSGLITKGHARLEVAQRLKLKTAPVDFQDYATEAEELSDMIADNRIAELALADRTMLRELAEHLDNGKFDMDLTGFDQLALEELMTAAPPAQNGENDPNAEWAGMPIFQQDGILENAYACIVRFKSVEDRAKFEEFLGWKLSHKGNIYSTWFPKSTFDQLGSKAGIAYDES